MDMEQVYAAIAPALGVVMVAAFGAIALWAYWPGHKARFERDGQIPLRDGD